MGKLRIEPISKQMDPDVYRQLWQVLRDARNASVNNRVYYDLDDGETPAKAKKDFKHVADKEGLDVQIRGIRKSNALEFTFNEPAPARSSQRIGADEYKEKVLAVISSAGKPLKKGEILAEADLSGSTWNIRIKELLKEGKVIRQGERRDATYKLA